MSFQAITSGEITSGKPVASTTQTKIKDNFDDHEARLLEIEGGAGTTYPPLIFRVNGPYPHMGAVSSLLKTTTNFPITITGVRLLIDTAGSSGTTEVDVLYKRGVGSYTSILSTRPSAAYSAGNDALSSNAVLDAGQTTLQAGDIIRLDITSAQVGAKGFLVRIDYIRGS